MRMTVAQSCQVGMDFRDFLKRTDRATVKGRLQLKTIYNEEFRYNGDECIRGPNFSALLYALKVTNRICFSRGNVRFKSENACRDQWYNPSRNKQPMSPVSGLSSPGPSQASPGPVSERQDQINLARKLLAQLKRDKSGYASDKNGVIISSDLEVADRTICLCVEDDDQHVMRLRVENVGSTDVYFTYYTLLHWLQDFTLEDEQKVTRARPLKLTPGDNYEIQVQFQTTLVGFYPAKLAFEFKPDLLPSSATFHIVRDLEVQRVTSLGKELAPVAPYRYTCISTPPISEGCPVVDGEPPERQSIGLKAVIDLKPYKVPQHINRLIDVLRDPDLKMDQSQRNDKALLESPLTMENYCEKFQLMLYLEELQMVYDIKRYNIPNSGRDYAVMHRDQTNKKLLILEVPGVAENRPSVLWGDKILVCPIGESGEKYCGYVHALEQESVKLGFSSKLLDRFIDGMKFRVEFTVGRLPLKLQHRAAELAVRHRLGPVLFPSGPPPSPALTQTDAGLPSLSLFDRKLEKNHEQYKAVQHIVAGSSKPAPYLVFGPPGTGKTVTVVEAIRQIVKTWPNCHILACAPSNSASDLICRRLVGYVDKSKLFRMYASSMDRKRIPDELKACSNLVGDVYMYPLKEDLLEYTVIVTTLCTAGRLVTGGIPPGHFSHVFIDEAGHAVETECIIPLAGLLQPGTGLVVLAGDPMQLGPILRSPLVQKNGMDKSLLERLMDTVAVYQKTVEASDDGEEDFEELDQGSFDPRYVTKLLRNYRSNAAILEIPNSLFYANELKVCADEALTHSFFYWEHLVKPGFPMIFHGVAGLDTREQNSPSWFNVAEVEQLMSYVRKLLEKDGRKGRYKILPKDIGIIAPYRKQVLKIRKGLQMLEKDMRDINLTKNLKVGSVEEFQGQERMVILVSTVRSSPEFTSHDQHFNLGFVKNEKRFNVAVTRAKALLITVGNPLVLRGDPVWNRFITYHEEEGGYTGLSYTEEEEDVVARVNTLFSIKPQGENGQTEESALQQELDPEWRNEL